ncbi:MAG: CoA-binding protein [Deltaproteobacteria bacterium]|nr:CoA-binding protein [Deltaproteobacteria bacterium]
MTGACDFERIFNPKSVVIVGVSSKPGFGFGRGMFNALMAMGFAGSIYPVSPKGGEIDGLKIYETVEEIPGEVDFAVISIAARHVPEALEACRKKGAAGAEILSAGFSETETPEGTALEEEVKRIAGKGIRVIGPNCFGIYCPESGLTLIPGPDLSREPGPVAFLSQSGGMSVDFAHIGKWMGVRFSKVVSFGNGADLRESELLNYLLDDPDTGVITMYVEGVENGRDFFSALRRTAERKPVIVYKGGLSDSGGRAVASHTASMGGSGVIWRSALRQCNAVQVGGIMEMAQTSLAFSLLPHKIYKGVSVMGGGGALGVNACDVAESLGLEIPRLKEEIEARIISILPRPGSSAGNPIDVANPFVSAQILKEVLLLAAGDEKIDLQIMIQLLYHYKSLAGGIGADSIRDVSPHHELAQGVQEVVDTTGKPVIVVLPNLKQEIDSMDVEEVMREARKAFLDRGIPVFDDISDALKAVNRVSDYCRKKHGTPLRKAAS